MYGEIENEERTVESLTQSQLYFWAGRGMWGMVSGLDEGEGEMGDFGRKLLKKAVELGDVQAKRYVAKRIIEDGYTELGDDETAMRYLRENAAAGDELSQMELARKVRARNVPDDAELLYESGMSLLDKENDREAGFRLIQRAANMKHPGALREYIRMRKEGDGCTVDLALAEKAEGILADVMREKGGEEPVREGNS